ncbi:unnamed protein product [Kuraishia capsulata CBS 1993]|uniref:Protein kinase domain-containing protein n=1 Tax=Kuraishia capsulata CBS 1993 TaxID=1382522 RepID=W6MFG3_9ASCO|nr:uncharacterized protein KUCA_T00000494001 [Kuraishia capsulata CBS 1993]CDK24529.1 unnamed protein product [Kuraishia capsulata CBS 1993]
MPISMTSDPEKAPSRFHLREFKTLKTLGEGRYAKVVLAVTSLDHHWGVQPTELDNEQRFLYAIKIINTKFDKPALNFKNANSLAKIKNEVRIMSILSKSNHKNVLKLYSIVNNDTDKQKDGSKGKLTTDDITSQKHYRIYLIMDYCSIGELTLQNFQDSRPSLRGVAQKLRDIVLGLEFLHTQGIVHRDIKPSNLLVDPNGTVKLSDFGISYKLTGDEKSDNFELGTPCGTPLFLSPELCGYGAHDRQNRQGTALQGKKIDVWALGVTLFYLFFGIFPFFDENKFKLFQDISKASLEFPSFENGHLFRNFIAGGANEREMQSLYSQVKNLLSCMLVKDLSKRYSISQVKKHKLFLTEISKGEYEKEYLQYNDTILEQQDSGFSGMKRSGNAFKDTFSKLFVSRKTGKEKSQMDPLVISSPVSGSFKHVISQNSISSDLATTTSTFDLTSSSMADDDYSEAQEMFKIPDSGFFQQPLPKLLSRGNHSSTSLPIAQGRPSFSTIEDATVYSKPWRVFDAEGGSTQNKSAQAMQRNNSTHKRESVNTLPSQFSDITPNLSSAPGQFESPESIQSSSSSVRQGLVRSRPNRNLSDLALVKPFNASELIQNEDSQAQDYNFMSMGAYLDNLA